MFNAYNSSSLVGKSALITGGSQGLGLAIAQEFLERGSDVLICSRTRSDIEAARSTLKEKFPEREIACIEADISQAEDVARLFETAESAFGSYDILVNNAGVHGPIGRLEDNDFGAWTKAVTVNLVSVAHLCHFAISHFKAKRGGKIVNISGGGATAPQFGLSAYSASKAGLVRLTETLALECHDSGIHINAVAPGALATRLTEELATSGPEAIGEAAHQRVLEMLAKGGSPLQKAASLCAYLASSDSDGLTGRLISAVWDPWPFSRQQIERIMESDIYALRRVIPDDRGEQWQAQK